MPEWGSEFQSINNMLKFLKYQKSDSESTKRAYLRIIKDFCKVTKMNPDQLILLERSKVEKLVQNYCNSVLDRSRKRGKSVRSANGALTALKCFFRENGFRKEDGKELRIKCYHQPPRVRNTAEYVPELKEARRMAERARSKRNRAIIYTLISTGLRNSTLRALAYKDVKDELEKGQKHILIEIRPEMKSIDEAACKYNIPYYVFTSEQATQAIKEYIEERIEKYGGISDDEPLFISEHNQLLREDRRKKILSKEELQDIVHKAAKEAGIKDWKHVYPHALRKVFERVLRSRLSDGGNLDPKDQEFFMGHILSGSQDTYYDKTKIEEMRAKYAKLVFDEQPSGDSSAIARFAKILGINFDELRARAVKERGRELTADEEESLLEESIRRSLSNRQIEYEQKIISEESLQTYLDQNWEFVASLGSGKILIRKVKKKNDGTETDQTDDTQGQVPKDDTKLPRHKQTKFDGEEDGEEQLPNGESEQHDNLHVKDSSDSNKEQNNNRATTNDSTKRKRRSGTLDDWI